MRKAPNVKEVTQEQLDAARGLTALGQPNPFVQGKYANMNTQRLGRMALNASANPGALTLDKQN